MIQLILCQSLIKEQSHSEHFLKVEPISTTLQKNFPFKDKRLNKSSFSQFWSDLSAEDLKYFKNGIITQCNSKCSCRKNNQTCSNSVTDTGLSVRLRIALHSDQRDWHVVADEDIKQGTYLGMFSTIVFSIVYDIRCIIYPWELISKTDKVCIWDKFGRRAIAVLMRMLISTRCALIPRSS